MPKAINCVGIVLLSDYPCNGRMQHIGPLAPWCSYGKLLREYYDFPLDCYSVPIEEVAVATVPFEFNQKKQSAGISKGESTKRIALKHPLFHPHFGTGQDPLENTFSIGTRNMSGKAILDSWGIELGQRSDIPCMMVPAPIGIAILAGHMRFVMILIRWHRQFKWLQRHGRRLGPLPDFPASDSCIWELEGVNDLRRDRDDDAAVPFGVEGLDTVADVIRKLVPTISGDNEKYKTKCIEDATVAVEMLEAWKQGINNKSPTDSQKIGYSSADFINTIRFAKYLKGGGSALADVLKQALELAMPATYKKCFQALALSKQPSASLVRYHELALDLALNLTERERAATVEDAARVDWSDSSPIAEYDWLWSQFREVAGPNLIAVFEATVALERDIADFVARRAEDAIAQDNKISIPLDPLPEWKPWLDVLKCIHEYILPPMALASGQSGLAHKCEAKAFAWALVYSPDAVDEHALSYVCGTSDLGTESKCGAFNIDDSPEKLLPPWMTRVMGLDIDDPESQEGPPVGVADAPEPQQDTADDDADDDDDRPYADIDNISVSESEPGVMGNIMSDSDDGSVLGFMSDCDSDTEDITGDEKFDGDLPLPPPPFPVQPPPMPGTEDKGESWRFLAGPDETKTFVPNSIFIAELQHVCDNALKEVHTMLDWWPNFFAALKDFENILKYADRRRRYVHTCLKGTKFEKSAHRLDHFDAHLYEKRWKEVASFSDSLYALLPLLNQTFDAGKYIAGVDKEGKNFEASETNQGGIPAGDPHAVEKHLNNPLFLRYNLMVKLVDKAPTRLAEDCETCPCHRAMWAFMSKHMRAHMYTLHFENGYTSCPMAGCHAPDLAHDWVERKL